MWINSLNIPDVYVDNLFYDLTNGVILCQLIDRVAPGTVLWKRYAHLLLPFSHNDYLQFYTKTNIHYFYNLDMFYMIASTKSPNLVSRKLRTPTTS